MRLIIFGLYLGFGAMLHALIVGPTFDWSSAWTFGWLFGWPLMLIFTFSAFLFIFALLVCAVWACWEWLKTIAHWRDNRRKAREAMK